MNPDIILTFLGTSTSTGVPVIGCRCPVCTSDDPKLTRTRSSIHLQTPEQSILVDTGPDLREQALRESLTRVDSVLYTHAHLDHITGFDELRAFCWHRDEPLPLYGSKACLDEIQRMFQWAFLPSNTYKGYVKPDPRITSGPFQLNKLTVTPVPVVHGSVETQGYRFDYPGCPSAAYLPDVKHIPDSSWHLLENIPLLIVDGLHHREHATHMNFTEALDTAEELGAGQIYLTHLSHELKINQTEKDLPANAHFAYDGLRIHFNSQDTSATAQHLS
ncbi:MBL fold metallo-hydrolase [Oceaniferula marina]|uniref:MBL fold metallo-hydrolase n=1 Tax=Oceaniferula marina TaxID=2748318 RepID=UPI001D047BB4|nr:MBL fold metallo-hydrolase [Oceaniferula marina]